MAKAPRRTSPVRSRTFANAYREVPLEARPRLEPGGATRLGQRGPPASGRRRGAGRGRVLVPVDHHHLRPEDARGVAALPHQRPPVVEEQLEGAPHRHPPRDDQPLAHDLAEVARGEPRGELGEREEDREDREPHQERHLPLADVMAHPALQALDHVAEVRPDGLLDGRDGQQLGGLLRDPDDQLHVGPRREVLHRTHDVLHGVLIEVPLAEGCRVPSIEQLPGGPDLDVDAGLALVDPVSPRRGRAHGRPPGRARSRRALAGALVVPACSTADQKAAPS
jgi:hypothetical protein